MTPTANSALVARAQAGDRDAFGELVSRYGGLVHGLCKGMAGSTWDAQDLAHDAFVEAWLKLPSLRDPDCFASWLRTLTLNVCRMWHRNRRREREGLAQVHLEEAGSTEAGDLSGRLFDGLSQLSSDHRLALALHYWEDLSYEEIAAFLDVAAGTVMSRLHRARADLKKRMKEMSPGDEPAAAGAEFRHAVNAEIEVLLQVWEEEMHQGDIDSRYRSATCQRLSVLLESAPDLLRPVLATMDEALTEHVAIRVRRIGAPTLEVALACAFAADDNLRQQARPVLCKVLGSAPDHNHTDKAHRLPLRTAASLIVDGVIRSPSNDADKAALLVELLCGCEDGASVILVSGVLLCYPEHSFSLLWQLWWAGEWTPESSLSPILAALCRFGSRFLASLTDELASDDPLRLRQALVGTEAAVNRIGYSVLTREPGPDPELEWRTGGGVPPEDIDAEVRLALCEKLAVLADDKCRELRDLAIAVLGIIGRPDYAAVVRSCLRHQDLSTRVAGIVSVNGMGDEASAPDLLHIARHDEVAARRAALHALGQLRVDTATDLLIELIDDAEVRPQAISALGQIGDDAALNALKGLTKHANKKIARLAANALYGGQHTSRPASATTRARLRRVRGENARPLLQVSVVAAIRNLPAIRPYPEAELTRFIGEVCSDYSTTRRELVMGPRGLMVRQGGVYELSESGRAVWRLERFLKDHYSIATQRYSAK